MDELRSNVRRMLNNQDNIRIVGEARNGREALELVKELQPHVVLMDINMPEIDGLKAAEMLAKDFPNVQTVIMSIQGEQEYFRRAMKAGAKDFLIKPFSTNDLIDTIQNVFNKWVKDRPELFSEEPRADILTFFATKGGVGRTTLAVNLAAGLVSKGKKVLLIDASLQFGDVAITLNQPAKRTIYHLVESGEEITLGEIEKNIIKHESGIDLLLAPKEPAFAEAVKSEHFLKIIENVETLYNFIIFDMPPSITEKELAILDRSTMVLLVATLEISSLKNTKICLKTFSDINFDLSKIKLILNKEIPNVGFGKEDLESGLAIPVYATVPMEAEIAQRSLNHGEAFVLKSPASAIARSILGMADRLVGTTTGPETGKSAIFKIKDLLFGS
ncbi:MAG: Two-component transcriptional response regulator, LuxR family [Candidatus Rifleibacterium amylolyticum]|nr:MAG: Two-component transcriptional response regulator, LuxR family [Candidatus Rifleibacterium amylolyticum]